MDYFFYCNNPNFHDYSSPPSSSTLATNKDNKSFKNHIVHEKEENRKKKKKKKDNRTSTTQVVKLSTDPQSVAARERRHRISERFKILQSLIPGGESKNMDTVSMLEEAIQYIKFLKHQILIHQATISFVHCDYGGDQETHQDLFSLYQFGNDDRFSGLPPMEEPVLPQLGFEGYCFQGEEKMVSFSHDHMMYP